MDIRIFKLKFLTPLHIGTNRPGTDDTELILHSDMLYSAIISAWYLLYPEDRIINEDNEAFAFPAFRLSSAFPYYGDHLFFPRPFFSWEYENRFSELPAAVKKAKNIRFLEEPLFRSIANGNDVPFREDCMFEPFFLTAEPLPEKERGIRIFSVDDITRIRHDVPGGNETLPFQFTSLWFNENAGLFFLVRFNENRIKDKFTSVMRFLGDSGFGGDRSSGYGKFSIAAGGSFQFPDEPSEHFITLSLFNPEPGSLAEILKGAQYHLLSRMGWVSPGRGVPYRRKSIRMFAEGSVFKGSAADRGRNLKVMNTLEKTGHPVFRFGQALTYPFNIRSTDHES